jgi:NAD(P)-dependent dehydrogenase (short-subunit alcohol dehydrogenase family)
LGQDPIENSELWPLLKESGAAEPEPGKEVILKKGGSDRYLRELFDLEGKVVVVIGGTGVVCGAMAWGLWRAGCRVVLVGRNQEKADAHFREWGSSPDEARFFRADVTERDQVTRIVPAVIDWFGRIDIWINGAGINPPIPYFEISDEAFETILSANLKSVHLGCQTIGKHWTDHGQKGCIINLSSMSAIRPLSRVFVYSLAKAAMWNLTQNLAREWACHGIRVNALCPGFFPAEQNRKVLDASRVKAIMDHTPMGRFGESEELIGATLLLASARAGSFITGSSLVVDGGFSATTI